MTMMSYQQGGMCSECGQPVDVIKGHKNNWPRRIAREALSIEDAVTRFCMSLDSGNKDFAVAEFASELQERFGVSLAVAQHR